MTAGVLAAIGIAAVAVTATRTGPVGQDPIATTRDKPRATTGEKRLKKGDALPEFILTDDMGKAFTSADLRGRLTVVTFMFSRCPVADFCPLMSKRFKELQRELDAAPSLRNVQLRGITLDPKFDTPEVLRAYASAMGADPARWRFLTGTPDEVDRLTRAFSIHVERNGALLDHTLATALIDEEGRVTDFWRGNAWTTAEVNDALRRELTRNATE
jgi:protein SCO1/2